MVRPAPQDLGSGGRLGGAGGDRAVRLPVHYRLSLAPLNHPDTETVRAKLHQLPNIEAGDFPKL
jgi:hypothetical protein